MPEITKPAHAVLREICMDSRKSTSDIAKAVKLSRGTVQVIIHKLETALALHYVPEFDLSRLGFVLSYTIKVKLRPGMDIKRLRKALEESTPVQFAAVTKGDFDLFIFVTTSDPIEFIRWENKFRAEFAEMVATWETVHVVFNRLGFFPVKDSAIVGADVPAEQKKLLLGLNGNARISFTALARDTGLTLAIARYQFRKVLKEGYVKRFSAVLEKPPTNVNLIVFVSYAMRADHEERSRRARRVLMKENEFQPTNTWAIVAETSGTSDTLRLGSFESVKDAYETLGELDSIYGGPEFIRNQSAIVVDVLVGAWPSRNVDLGKCYDMTSWRKKDE